MATVIVNVEAYPESGVSNIEIQEETAFGWVDVLDSASVGTYPSYTTAYSVTATTDAKKFRHRWTVDGVVTKWVSPLSLSIVPDSDQEERIKLAIIGKTVRLLALPQSPMGAYGELSEFGAIAIRPDYQPSEHLMGLRGKHLVANGNITVTAAEVISMGFSGGTFSAGKTTEITDAITAATHAVDEYLRGWSFK